MLVSVEKWYGFLEYVFVYVGELCCWYYGKSLEIYFGFFVDKLDLVCCCVVCWLYEMCMEMGEVLVEDGCGIVIMK